MNFSSATNSSLSSFSDECETTLPELSPTYSSITTSGNELHTGKKLVHKVEPIFTTDKSRMRIFLEDGSLSEYSIQHLTTAEELIDEMSSRHSLGSDMRRYRLTLSDARDASWRSIRYIRPQQKVQEISQWSSLTETTICTLRVVIVPPQAELLADMEPITFTYLYRQSINDYIRERAGSEMTIDTAVQLTALLILDESLCTNTRSTILVKRSWLLRQLLPRSLIDQFSLKQLIHRIREHLHDHRQITQLSVAKKFIKIFSENTRSFAGKLFPVKFPDKHRDSILLVGPRHPIAILDQARRVHSPVITLVSTWSHLSRVIVKQYRNGVAIRLLITPRTTTTTEEPSILQQEISFLIHTNLLNDLMAFIEGYSQLESTDFPLAIERISYLTKSPSSSTPNESEETSSSNETRHESPFVQRILSNRKYHRTYSLVQEKLTPPASPSLYELTRQFFSRNSPKTLEMDDRETISNVPNRTTLITWRSLADTQTINPPIPPPVFYRTVIDVKKTEQILPSSNDDDEPDAIDLTTSYGYYGSVSFPIRPPSPYADGLIWSQMSNQRHENEETDREICSSSAKYTSIHYNTNNNNNNNNSQSPDSIRTNYSWKQTFDRILKRKKSGKVIIHSNEDLIPIRKHVHWIDSDQTIFNFCQNFVDNLKLFVQNILNDQYEEIYIKNCQKALDKLQTITDCSQLQQAFDQTIKLASKSEKLQLLQQQTFIAHLISRTILSS